MGYRAGKFKLWWRTQEDAEAHKFRPVLSDNDAMLLGNYVVDSRVEVHLFVEHDEGELPDTPLGFLRYIDGTIRPKNAVEPQPKKTAPFKQPTQTKALSPVKQPAQAKRPGPFK